MVERVRNRRAPEELSEADVDAAIARIEARDGERGRDARHVYDTLTWGKGPGVIDQSGLQNWLWYQLPTKYLTDEPEYVGRLAGIAAELFDELGLDAYAAVCRSEATARVHAAFERSDGEGRTAMRKAADASGIEPPDLDHFVWAGVMGMEEASARSNVERALERAIAAGTLAVGGRGWRSHQREVAAAAFDADHPTQPGQTWRTVVLTERLSRWTEQPATRSSRLAQLRGQVANRLLSPIAPPVDVAERMRALTRLLELCGGEQALTSSGYLNTSFVRLVDSEELWEDPFPSGRPPRSEADSLSLVVLRELLERMGALRKRGKVLKRTSSGAQMADDPALTWKAMLEALAVDPWGEFVVGTIGLQLLAEDAVSAKTVRYRTADLALEMGWRTSKHAGADIPSEWDVLEAFRDTWAVFELLGLLTEDGDWSDRRWSLTPAGRTTMFAILRASATGPSSPW